MAFKPKNAGKSSSSNGNFEDTRNFPVPKGGPRKARVSLIIDLGEQNREDFEDPKTKELKPQKPAHQVAIFADLVSDVVDYGSNVGKQQYRLMLNKSFQGVVQGINFQAVPPRDANGDMIEGKKWGLHPANLLTKLAKAVDLERVTIDDGPDGMDISLLLNQPFMAQVEVKETEGKKKDANGDPIIYKNVHFKGASPVPMVEDDDGNEAPMPVAKLTQPARCITFDDATVEDIQFIRGNLLTMIKNANDYAGSQMQKAIEEFESKGKGGKKAADEGDEEEEAPAKPAAKTPKKPTAPKKPVPQDDDDEDVTSPF
jgi:hypothetical protein